MKILITYASYGNGHKAVAENIYNYFKEKNKDYELKLIDVMEYGNLLARTDKKIFNLNYKFPINHYFFSLEFNLFNNKILTSPYKILTKFLFKSKLTKEILDFNPDILISTHFFGSILIGLINNKYHKNIKIITIITDYKAHALWLQNSKNEDKIIIGNNYVKNDLLNFGIDNNKIFPIGIPISSKFKYTKKISKLQKTILFLGGGGNGSNFSYNYLKDLLKYNLNINIIFVAGNNTKLKNKVMNIGNKNITVLGYSNNIPTLLAKSDLVITKPGGIAITEIIAMKVPMILIPGNGGPENYNTEYIVKNKLGLSVKHPKDLGKTVNSLLNNPKCLKEIETNLNKIKDNNALEELYKIIKEMDVIK